MPTIAVINQKGGVGKTTTVASLGSAIAASGKNVCVIDLDPQAHLTLSMGVEPDPAKPSMYEVLTTDATLQSVCRQVNEHLWLLPSIIDLAAAEVEMVGTVGREQILRDKLAEFNQRMDFILIDCPPSLGLLTLNALAAADDVVIPLQPHFLALQGLGKLLETVSLVQRRINSRLKVAGVVLCMYESSARLTGEVVADLRAFLDASRSGPSPWASARIMESVIRRNVKLAECPSYGKTIFQYEPKSNGAADYQSLAREFLDMYQPSATAAQPAPAADQNNQPASAGEAPTVPQHSPQSQPQPAPRGDVPAPAQSPGNPPPQVSQGDTAAGPAGPANP